MSVCKGNEVIEETNYKVSDCLENNGIPFHGLCKLMGKEGHGLGLLYVKIDCEFS
jgi:hypothetical protein